MIYDTRIVLLMVSSNSISCLLGVAKRSCGSLPRVALAQWAKEMWRKHLKELMLRSVAAVGEVLMLIFRIFRKWLCDLGGKSVVQTLFAVAMGLLAAASPAIFGIQSGMNAPQRQVSFSEYEITPEKGVTVPVPADRQKRLTILANSLEGQEAISLVVVGHSPETANVFVKRLTVPRGEWVLWNAFPQAASVRVEIDAALPAPPKARVLLRVLFD